MPHWFHAHFLTAGPCRLSPQESRHACASFRLRIGEEVVLFSGSGLLGPGLITSAKPDAVVVDVREVVSVPRRHPCLYLNFAVPKGPRADTLIEKCCELGVAGLRPLMTARSISGAADVRLEKWQRRAIEAAKQSQQAWTATVEGPLSPVEALDSVQVHDMNLVASLEAGAVPLIGLAGRLAKCRTVQAFVGPEGGWTESEQIAFRAAQVTPVNLGPGVLRIETAAIALAAFVHQLMTGPQAASPEPLTSKPDADDP